jgi:UrcA family protein
VFDRLLEEATMKIAIKRQSQPIASVIASTLVALASNGSAGKALASEPTENISKVVTYSGLDLNSEQGAKVLYGLLRDAAKEVCRPLESRELTLMRAWKSCVANSLASAVAEINKPTLTALYEKNVSQSADGNS